MAGEMLEAYRRIERRQYLMAVCLTISTTVTLILLIFYAQLSGSSAQNIYRYATMATNFSSAATAAGLQVSSLKESLFNISASYNRVETNLTNPYTKELYANYRVDIPARIAGVPKTNITSTGPIQSYNTTYVTTYNTYNFTFNAPYLGYILLNATSGAANTQSNTIWEFLVSNGRLLANGTLSKYSFQSGVYNQGPYSQSVTGSGVYRTSLNYSVPYSVYAPLPSQTSGSVRIPVNSGVVRVWIVNYANQSIGVTFSASYTGFHNR